MWRGGGGLFSKLKRSFRTHSLNRNNLVKVSELTNIALFTCNILISQFFLMGGVAKRWRCRVIVVAPLAVLLLVKFKWLARCGSQLQQLSSSMAEKPTAEAVYAIPTYQPCYKPPIFEFNQLATEKVDYFLVLDFEGVINKDKGSPNVMEVIEFPVLKINATTLRTESEFHTYVQPIIHPRLNSKCTEITGITQGMVDGKPILPDVLKQLDDWMKSEGLLSPKVKFIFVTCGDWDLKSGISTNCDYLKLEYQDYLKRWINIKTYFGDLMGKKGFGMKSMLEDLGLSLDGRHHSGIDDCRNITKILVTLIKRGSSLRNGWVKPRMLVQKSRRHQE